MAISDTERREVAERLRGEALAWSESFPETQVDMDEVEAIFYELARFAGISGVTYPEVIYARFADLIDRPTCELVEVWDGEAKQHYLDCTACHFGRLAIELDDAGVRFNSRALWAGVDYTSLTHCPYCGAEVGR